MVTVTTGMGTGSPELVEAMTCLSGPLDGWTYRHTQMHTHKSTQTTKDTLIIKIDYNASYVNVDSQNIMCF